MTVPARDDRGSLPVALLVTMVGVLLSTLLVHTVLGQNTETRGQTARVAALNAAQTGLDIALGHLRAANNGATAGVLAKLPCLSLKGSVAAVTGAEKSTYEVEIDYYSVDPQNRPPAWLADANNAIRCIQGAGTFSTPAYALLRSTGSYPAYAGGPRNAAGDWIPTVRTLQGTYTFKTNDQNISGGLIHLVRSAGATDLCFDAGSGSPSAGTPLTVKPCSAGSVAQTWAYNLNLTLSLVSSRTPTMPLGLCLDAGTPQTVGKTVYLQPCGTPETLPRQQWSYNDNANFQGTSNGVKLDGPCITVQSANTTGSPVVLNSCSANTGGVRTFYPEQTTGAGAAGASSGQLVNFKQFGRCLDVTNKDVGSTFLISWQCKQSPDPGNVAWNQKWTITPKPVDGDAGVTGSITTTNNGVYCLKSPRSTLRGRYVTVQSCSTSSLTDELRWKLFRDTGTYATSYTIVDSAGNCLSPTDPTAPNPDLFSSGQLVSKIVVAVCDGSALQKWNAPTSVLSATPLKDISET